MRLPNSLLQSGFSLIEMVVAITVLGILSTSAAMFLRGPITSYFDTEQRVDLADAGGAGDGQADAGYLARSAE